MAFAMMILPCMDGIAKYLSTMQSMSPGQVAFYRFFFQLLLTLPLLLTVEGASAFRAKRPWMNLLRGAGYLKIALVGLETMTPGVPVAAPLPGAAQ